jgi:hypothetical protein
MQGVGAEDGVEASFRPAIENIESERRWRVGMRRFI